MQIRNINFGARISENTFNFLKEAREKGLKTNKMENLMKKTMPDRVIYTNFIDNEIDGQENKGIKSMGIMSPVSSDTFIPILDLKIKECPEACYIGEAYKINQKTIDLISKNLKEIQKDYGNGETTISSEIERKLIKKFGEPISD